VIKKKRKKKQTIPWQYNENILIIDMQIKILRFGFKSNLNELNLWYLYYIFLKTYYNNSVSIVCIVAAGLKWIV